METLYNIAILMPFAVCVIWFIMGLLKWKKTFRTWMSNLMLFQASIFSYASTAFLTRPFDLSMFPIYDILCIFSGLAFIPCIWFYIISLKGLRANAVTKSMVVIVVLSMGIVSSILYWIMGGEEALRYNSNWLLNTPYVPENPALTELLDVFIIYVYSAIIMLELLAFLIYVVWDSKGMRGFLNIALDYLVRGEKVSVYHAQMVMSTIMCLLFLVRSSVPEPYIVNHPVLNMVYSVLMAVVCAVICYTTLFNDVKEISIIDFFCPVVPSSALDEIPDALMPQEEPVLTTSDSAFGLHVSNEEFAFSPLPDNVLIPLRESFKSYVEDGRRYLEKGMTLARIADEIKSNKNYVSRMVHMTYGMTFPEYMNKKRIEYSKELLLKAPDIKQEALADECGFANASAFNRAFKKETSQTPRMWLLEQKQNSQNS